MRQGEVSQGTECAAVEGLLMEMLHSGRTQNDEESHPEGRPLKGNGLIGLSLFCFII